MDSMCSVELQKRESLCAVPHAVVEEIEMSEVTVVEPSEAGVDDMDVEVKGEAEAFGDEANAEEVERGAVEPAPEGIRNVEAGVLYVDDLNCDVDMLQLDGLPNLCTSALYGYSPTAADILDRESFVVILGMRDVLDVSLVQVGKGKARGRSEHSDKWSMKRVEQLREALGWDTTIPLGDLPLQQLDDLLSNLFSRVVKMSRNLYPSGTLKNMMIGFNRVIRHASSVRCLNRKTNDIVGPEFNIKSHPAFASTRLTIDQAIKKSAAEGANKKRRKVETLTLAMEYAILADVEHQIIVNTGCQKRLAVYLMCCVGITGCLKLHQLMRFDLELCFDKHGQEYLKFEERHSKNNQQNVNRTEEHQFRKTYHNYELDFILTFKQYTRHLPPLEEGVKPDLFMQPIPRPASNVWYNKVHKVSVDSSTSWLKNMVNLVGISDGVISNKSGRMTLITRMVALGVPDEVGMMISSHHTQDGYARYDRTQKLKMEAATYVSCNPGVSYETALQEVSKQFVQEDIIGSTANLRPLLALACSFMASTHTLLALTLANQDMTMTLSSANAFTSSFQATLNQNPFENPFQVAVQNPQSTVSPLVGAPFQQSVHFPVLKGKGHVSMMLEHIQDTSPVNSGIVRVADIFQQH